ncbi:MAG: SufD family Fe-S cluster assembly protein [Ruminiclostridium sp.]|nr:SufD family Fe-S cluster assembly protein [Ruminiclostridium sp.]
MTKTRLNILPTPTFGHLGVNYTEREVGFAGKENISVPEGADRQIIQFVDSDDDTCVAVGKNARLQLVRVCASEQGCVSKVNAALDEDAELGLIQLYLGGNNVSEIIAELNGSRSFFRADIGYDLGKDCTLDLNLAADHNGRKSISEINAGGVLRENAQKIFKGTIDFRTGSSGAKGSEKEDVILMDGAVVNKTVPVILCAEEDVEGSHGASIGRIDEGQVFYMKSRGIPEEKIYEMITRSKLARIIRKIGDEKTEQRIYNILGWGDEVE